MNDNLEASLVGSFWKDQAGNEYKIVGYDEAKKTFTLKSEDPSRLTILATWKTLNEGQSRLPLDHAIPASQWSIKPGREE